jgi:hypothetical protein
MPLYTGILLILAELMRKHLKASANFVMHVAYLFYCFMKRRKSFEVEPAAAQS